MLVVNIRTFYYSLSCRYIGIMKIKLIVISLFLALIASVTFNILLYKRFLKTYRELQQVRLDPAGEHYFNDDRLIDSNSPVNRIVLLGDSRIVQWDPLPSLENCEIFNRGISGQTSAQLLLRICHSQKVDR